MQRKLVFPVLSFLLLISLGSALSIHRFPRAFAEEEWTVYLPTLISRAEESVWQTFPSPVDKRLNDIAMVSPTDGWIIGDGNTFLRWDGQAWSEFQTATSGHFYSISMVTADEGWAVGLEGDIARWNGLSWESFAQEPDGNWLFGVDALTADDVWAVGNSGSILHWDGSSWSPVPSPVDAQLLSVTMVTA
ncbi:MAG: hypothetical protein R3293_26170, partial [Candidatus Promineifilaceae bacterium]|nr:hypothetical protein [Candidatus Promineifilaceae bacterium]